MAALRCTLCDRRAYGDTHLCKVCLVETYPPVKVSSLTQEQPPLAFSSERATSVLSTMAVVLGVIVTVLFIIVVAVN